MTFEENRKTMDELAREFTATYYKKVKKEIARGSLAISLKEPWGFLAM